MEFAEQLATWPNLEERGTKYVGWTSSEVQRLFSSLYGPNIRNVVDPSRHYTSPVSQYSAEAFVVQLTADGRVKWGDELLTIPEMKNRFPNAINLMRSEGYNVRLFVERYSDAKDADFALLSSVADDAGFDAIDQKALAWPTPVHLLEKHRQ